MSEPAAIRATFSDFRLVKGRKCAQFVFEVPIEEADAAVRTLGGLPQSATERWCGIALLDLAKPAQEPAKDKRKWTDLPPSQQAAMRCNEPAFQRYVAERTKSDTGGPDAAASFVRDWCEVESRSHIRLGEESGRLWNKLDSFYQFWLRDDG